MPYARFPPSAPSLCSPQTLPTNLPAPAGSRYLPSPSGRATVSRNILERWITELRINALRSVPSPPAPLAEGEGRYLLPAGAGRFVGKEVRGINGLSPIYAILSSMLAMAGWRQGWGVSIPLSHRCKFAARCRLRHCERGEVRITRRDYAPCKLARQRHDRIARPAMVMRPQRTLYRRE